MTKEKKKKHTALFIVLGVLAAVIIAFAVFIFGGKSETIALTIGDVPMDNVADGVYAGSYTALRWSTTVEVTVTDHQITGIQVTKPQTLAKDKTIDAVTRQVLKEQTPAVDAVSGATADKKAFCKAVENALAGAGN